MKLTKQTISSFGFGVITGLAGSALVGIFTGLDFAPAGAALPVFIMLLVIVGLTHYWKTLHMEVMRDELTQVKRSLSLIYNGIAETQGLVQLSGLDQPFPVPFGGSWALTPDAAVVLAREVVVRKPGVVVELGSGASTVMVGRLLKQLGHGRLISLDHDPEWASQTRRYIVASGLQDIVEVIDAPLTRQQFDGKDYDWYQVPEQLRDIQQIDMITVDGPPQAKDTSILSRYPALPAFAEKLSPQAIIYVDDAGRDTEQNMIKTWLQTYPGWTSRMLDTIPGTCILERQENGR